MCFSKFKAMKEHNKSKEKFKPVCIEENILLKMKLLSVQGDKVGCSLDLDINRVSKQAFQ